jgi:thiamine kinase-like enzyme
MIPSLTQELREVIDFDEITKVETIQQLWSGYGTLIRLYLSGSTEKSIIVKRISPPEKANHPRGWDSDVGHQRKLRSYEVETNWYTDFNGRTTDQCRTPNLIGFKKFPSHSILILEDLNQSGFTLRKNKLTTAEIKRCLAWLAAFHALFMKAQPSGLWDIGTYWQLETRQHELNAMADGQLKDNANAIHQKLLKCQYQTLVHGDAKYANFCFAHDGSVAAVDFQYVGRGCGMKDVAYLLSCIEGGITSVEMEEAFLSHYFSTLRTHLESQNSLVDFKALEYEWRSLYPFAWADFERFLAGWAPGHWKSNRYSKQQVKKVLDELKNET